MIANPYPDKMIYRLKEGEFGCATDQKRGVNMGCGKEKQEEVEDEEELNRFA